VSGLGAFAAFGAAALCLAFSSKVNSESFTPKFAVALLFAAVGIVPLARLFRAPSAIRWAARGAVGFLLVALVSALVSPSPALGIFGLYTWGTGWLLWLAAVGAFAIGASLGPEDRCWLFAGLLVGALGNALVAVYQIVVQPQGGGLVLYDGLQADGLLGNPIHLEALLLGALALVLGRACRSPLRWGAAVMLLAVGLEFTFERFALGILVLLVLYALYSYGLRRGGVFAVLIGIGYGIAYLSGGSGLGQRVTSGSADTTFGIRPRVWLEGAHYLLHHPLLGVGPGQFRTAMDSTATLSFFQNVLAGRILTDGHDIFAEVAVTTGFLGLICFLVWLTGAARMVARCSFLGFGAAMIAVGLVEPMNVAILPLVFLGLGAATAVRMRTHDKPAADASQPESGQLTPNGAVTLNARRASPYAIVTTIVALAIALLLGGTMVVGDAYMFNGTHHALGQPYDIVSAKDASSLLPYWPDSALVVAQIEAFDSTSAGPGARAALAQSRNWTAVAVNRDRSNPYLWVLLAGGDIDLREYGRAKADYLRALSCDKWYAGAFEGLGRLAGIQHKWQTAIHWYRLALVTVVKDTQDIVLLRSELAFAERNARTGHS